MQIVDLLGRSHRVSNERKLSDLHGVGCESCPLDGIVGLHKVKGLSRIQGRKAMLWAQSPGFNENLKQLELVGKVGIFVWDELGRLGLTRDDVDVQNVLRCRPINPDGASEHVPTKKELHCCSIYNEEALERNQQKAVVHLILGAVAATQLLGKEVRKDRPAFWHEPWQAYAVITDHPSYILRQGGKEAGWSYYNFLDRLKAVKVIMEHPGRWGYVRAQDYKGVISKQEVDALEVGIRHEATLKHRVSVDIEDGVVNGKPVIFLVGFGFGDYQKKTDWASWKGKARSVVLNHKGASQNPERLAYCTARLKAILEDPTIEKIFQHGSHDVKKLKEILGITVRGYTFDTEYATYLANSSLKAFGLEAIVNYFFPEFGDYKDIVADKWNNLGEVPLRDLVLYNCADCDITKRCEIKMLQKLTPLQMVLLQVYISAAFVITDMQTRGPILDRVALARVRGVIPKQIEILKRRLSQVAGKSDFNPGSTKEVAWLLYKKLRLPQPEDRNGNPTESTSKEVLETLILTTGSKVPKMVLDYRSLTKIVSTYLDGYERSADQHGGELRTIWRMTGASTGRMSSGGGDDAEASGLVNMQNFHGNEILLNMLVSDHEWHTALDPKADPEELFVNLAFDYKANEIRMLAETSEDELLCQQLRNVKIDIHCQVGKELTDWPVEKIAKDHSTRKLVKNFHFGLIYGLAKDGLPAYMAAKGVKVAKSVTDKFYDKYFKVYKGVKRWIDRTREWVDENHYVENIFGFRREIQKVDKQRGSYWANQAVNTPIQGAAHQMLLIAIANLHLKPKTYNLLQEPTMEVHDSIYFRVRVRDIVEAYHQGIHLLQVSTTEYIEKHFKRKLRVPFIAEAKVGFCLGSMVEYQGEGIPITLAAWRIKHAEVEASAWEDLMPVAV